MKIISVQCSLTYSDLTYPDTCLGTNPHSSTESDSLIRKFSYPDSQSGNVGVRISEVPLYSNHFNLMYQTWSSCITMQVGLQIMMLCRDEQLYSFLNQFKINLQFSYWKKLFKNQSYFLPSESVCLWRWRWSGRERQTSASIGCNLSNTRCRSIVHSWFIQP